MSKKQLFSSEVTIKIWNQYLQRVERLAKGLTTDQRHELMMEIQDHLFESFQQQEGKIEAEKLLNAIDDMGDPEVFVKPLIADHFLDSAKSSFNPKTIFKGLYYYVFGGAKYFLVSILYIIGYLCAFLVTMMALLKPFFPHHIGLFLHENGWISFGLLFEGFANFGIVMDKTPIRLELLGYWIIPIGIVFATLLYLFLTRTLPRSRKRIVPGQENLSK